MEQLGIPQPQAEAVTDIEDGRARPLRASAIRCWCARATCWAAAPCRSLPNEEALRHYLQTAVEVNDDSARAGRQVHHAARSWRSTPSATAATSSSPASWSTSSARASTPATRSASTRPSASRHKVKENDHRLYSQAGSRASASSAFTTSSSSCDGHDEVYVIEVNPRSSRTVPFLSKATGVQMADIATQVILGHSLARAGHHRGLRPRETTLVRQGAGLLLLEDPRGGRPTSRRR